METLLSDGDEKLRCMKRGNDEKQATQAANMVALKGKNQHKMDKLCGLMRQTEQLEAQIEADTLRYFRLAERVKHERSAMRDYANLQRMTETQLSAQMQHIRAIQEELAVGKRDDPSAKQASNSLKEMRRRLKAMLSAQENRKRRMCRQLA